MTTAAEPETGPDDALEHAIDFGPVGPGHFLVLPWSDDAPPVELRYDGLAPEGILRRFHLASHRVDSWRYIPLGAMADASVVVSSTSAAVVKARVVSAPPLLRGTVHGVVLPFGETFGVRGSSRRHGTTCLELVCDLLGTGGRLDVVRLSSLDRMNWELDGVVFDVEGPGAVEGARLPSMRTPEGALVCLLGDEQVAPPVESLRIWERALGAPTHGVVEIPLRFRVVPGTWPDIDLASSDGTSCDVTAPAHELRFRCSPGEKGSLLVDVGGCQVSVTGRAVTAGDGHRVVPGSAPIRVALYFQGGHAALTVDGLAPVLLSARGRGNDIAATAVTANLSGFTVASRLPAVGSITLGRDVTLDEAMVFGLREPRSSVYRTAMRDADGPGALFFESDRFAVHDRCVSEVDGADPAALVTDRRTVVSPIRVIEEFVWRDTAFGDMTRVVDRAEMWRSAVEPGRFPELTTSFRSIDAAFELALETFQRNSSGEFALPGESGMWSAGYFQGPGIGFGAWKRDTAHIALRSGNLLDPAVARASLAHVVNSGFDNGFDGDSLPAVAIWDYFLATGDESLIYETWTRLAEAASALDSRFDDRRGLVAAPQATSNDCFEEPEAGGFALSTEVYSMETYASLSRMAALPGIRDARAAQWATRASTMRRAILEQYWNPDHGYFTSGPEGSESHAKGYWETSGAEAALWGFLGAEAEPMTASILRRMRAVAMSEFGVVLFPYKEADNHFCGSVWYCWQAGIARAAARVGDAGLVHQLIAQQVRTVVRSKTFYEVTDAVTGESWRWPGQLWHAAGFVSLVFFGLLGIRYDLDGMTFTPAVAPEFAGARIHGLRYRAAQLEIEIRGHGSRCELTLDGQPVDRIAAETRGRHFVVLTMR